MQIGRNALLALRLLRFASSARLPAMNKLRALLTRLLSSAVLTIASLPAPAFEVAPTDQPSHFLKWGPSSLAGTSGGEVTWGFIAAGTPGGDYCGNFCKGESLDALPNFYPAPLIDNRTMPRTLHSLQPIFQAAFDAWSAVADVQFRYIGIDRSYKAVNDPTATSPMIRIDIWPREGLDAYFCAAEAYPPRWNGGNGNGHIFLNSNVGYQLSAAAEGSLMQDFPAGGGRYMNDLYALALRETGHTIGLADTPNPDSVMTCGDDSSSFKATYLRRKLRADDIAGARFLYGAPKGPHD